MTKTAGTGEAQRYAGNPFNLKVRLDRAFEELIFYRNNGRHHNDGETSTVKTHEEWTADAAELATALAVAVTQGGLEPAEKQKP